MPVGDHMEVAVRRHQKLRDNTQNLASIHALVGGPELPTC